MICDFFFNHPAFLISSSLHCVCTPVSEVSIFPLHLTQVFFCDLNNKDIQWENENQWFQILQHVYQSLNCRNAVEPNQTIFLKRYLWSKSSGSQWIIFICLNHSASYTEVSCLYSPDLNFETIKYCLLKVAAGFPSNARIGFSSTGMSLINEVALGTHLN